MKSLLLSLALLTSVQVIANEFDPATEAKCHAEIKKMGCVGTSGDENMTCVESKKASLTSVCKELHTARKKSN